MVVAVVAVGSVKPALDEVIDVVAMRYRRMSAAIGMAVRRIALDRGCVATGVSVVDGDHVLVHVILMRVVQMAVVQVVDVIVVPHRGVAALRSVLVGMGAFVNLVCHARTLRRRAQFLKVPALSAGQKGPRRVAAC